MVVDVRHPTQLTPEQLFHLWLDFQQRQQEQEQE